MKTRGTSDTKKRTRRGGPADATDTAPAQPPSDCTGPVIVATPNLPQTVALEVKGDWAAPPSIGQLEAALTAEGRTQHRIWRIDMGPTGAVVHVHPSDVASCVGIIDTGSLQLKVSVMGDKEPPVAAASISASGNAAPAAVVPTPALAQAAQRPSTVVPSLVVKAVPSPVQPAVVIQPPKKRAKAIDALTPAAAVVAGAVAPPPAAMPQMVPVQPSAQLCEAISYQLLGGNACVGGESSAAPMAAPPPILAQSSDQQQPVMLAMRAPPQLATSAAQGSQMDAHLLMPPPGSAARQAQEDKQRRLYRVGLSYRCGRCGKPKKGHVCDMPEDGEGAPPGSVEPPQLSPAPAILATTVRKGTPPALLGSPLYQGAAPLVACAAASSPLAVVSPRGAALAVASPAPRHEAGAKIDEPPQPGGALLRWRRLHVATGCSRVKLARCRLHVAACRQLCALLCTPQRPGCIEALARAPAGNTVFNDCVLFGGFGFTLGGIRLTLQRGDRRSETGDLLHSRIRHCSDSNVHPLSLEFLDGPLRSALAEAHLIFGG